MYRRRPSLRKYREGGETSVHRLSAGSSQNVFERNDNNFEVKKTSTRLGINGIWKMLRLSL